MSRLLELTGPNHEKMVKEAVIGAALGLMNRVGKVIVRNPGKALGVGFSASDVGSGMNRMSDAASGARNIAQSVGRVTM